jgi:hypothetical protein
MRTLGGWMRAALGLVLFLVLAGARAAPSVDFAGESYHLDYYDRAKHPDGSAGDGVAEFTLPGETVNDWTKLFAYHIYPDGPADPALAAETLGKTVKKNNKDANYSLTQDAGSGEAIVDFLTWAPGSDVMEFNVFKYAKAGDESGLVALQYAQRFKAKDIPVEEFRQLREHMVDEMSRTGAEPARAYFVGGNEDEERSPD